MPASARAEDGGRIDHIGNPHYAAELTCLARALVVEPFDFDLLGTEQASQSRLTTTPRDPTQVGDSLVTRQ